MLREARREAQGLLVIADGIAVALVLVVEIAARGAREVIFRRQLDGAPEICLFLRIVLRDVV